MNTTKQKQKNNDKNKKVMKLNNAQGNINARDKSSQCVKKIKISKHETIAYEQEVKYCRVQKSHIEGKQQINSLYVG